MTLEQMERIKELRHENYSYRFIGDALKLSPNTVKSICRRNNFTAQGARKTKAEKEATMFCKNCGALLKPNSRHGQQFCSSGCRYKWWKSSHKVTVVQT